MSKKVFNPESQNNDVSSKIVVGLERISEAFKALIWERAKVIGLSPIQIQILIFIAYHKTHMNNVSHLAKEFNVTKPTISDAVRVLINKDLLLKDHSSSDSRSFSLVLSEQGKKTVEETENFSDPVAQSLKALTPFESSTLFGALSKLIHELNEKDILTVQRTCYGCRFYSQSEGKNHYCNLLHMQLKNEDIRLDCPEFEQIPS